MTTEIRIELADAVHQELRRTIEEHGLTWSEYFGLLAARDGPDPELAGVAREAAEHARGASSGVAVYGAVVHELATRDACESTDPDLPRDGAAATNGATGPGEDAGAWDAGLSEPERETVEALAGALREQGGAVSVDALDSQVPLAHMADVTAGDVAAPLADHPDVTEVSTGVFAPA